MNGKKAKKLRRLAEKMTVGQPVKDYTVLQVNTLRGPRNILRLTPGCTRSVYQRLKKLAN